MINKTPGMDTNSLQFAAFLNEGLNYVDVLTPTKINSGGCGVFAQLLCEELEKFNIKHSIFALFPKEAEEYKNSMMNFFVTGKADNKTAPAHIVTCINDSIYVDSDGIINEQVCIADIKVEITKEQLDMLVEKGEWNPTFDKKCIPVIEKNLGVIFQHLNDFHPGIFQYPKKGVEFTRHTISEIRKRQMMQTIFGC